MLDAVAPPPLRWVVAPAPDPGEVQGLAAALNVPRPLAALLAQRGFTDADAARRFLKPSLDQLSDPAVLAGMPLAAVTVANAVRRGTPILVHGDYDVDGQCATALLTRALRAMGGTVHPFVPHRLTDGYDFGAAGLLEAERVDAGLIITCDCGITAVQSVAAARAAGRQVVVTDHHLPGPVLPDAEAVIDPQRADDTSGLTMLCGTGIAFKLVQAVARELDRPAALPFHFLDLVALATVADVVPLVGENRILVRHGLRLLADSRWAGLRALIDVAGLTGKEVRAGHLGFMLGPRLNAAGRVADAKEGLRLLLVDDPLEARTLADRLDRYNAQRQALDQRILEEALQQVERTGVDGTAAYVLAGEDWHPGVVGIVASRVVERYGRPTFLVALDGETGKGSGRSISRFNLHAALVACGDLLDRYGGHHMAAGLTVRRDRLDDFRARFSAYAASTLRPEDLGPEQRVDLEISLAEADGRLEQLVRYLEPCGMGNASPVFGVRGVRLLEARVVGNNHLKATLSDGTGRLAAVGFGMGDRLARLTRGPADVAFKLELNEWNGSTTLQARIVAAEPAA